MSTLVEVLGRWKRAKRGARRKWKGEEAKEEEYGFEQRGVEKERKTKKIRSVVVVESGGRVERTKGCDQKREKKMKNVIRKDESTRTRIYLVCCSTNSTNQPKGKSVVRLRSFVHSQQTISQQQHVKVE